MTHDEDKAKTSSNISTYQNSKLKSEVQNSYGFENKLDKRMVSSLDEFLR